MRIDVLTLFPQMFTAIFNESVIGRAQENGIVQILTHDIRDWAKDKHRVVDDTPYGGGPGMVLKPEPMAQAIRSVSAEAETPDEVILLTPQGSVFTQQVAEVLAEKKRLLFVCGHYEGVDERIRTSLITKEISIGDYVLTGGELPSMVVIDAVVRLIPGVLGCTASHQEDSFQDGLLEYPQYTRPAVWQGMTVPPVLLSGDHGKIKTWRRQQSLLRTLKRRPELLEQVDLTPEDQEFLNQLKLSETKGGEDSEPNSGFREC